MRRLQKKQVEDFIKLLNQAHTEIINCIEKNAVSETLLLLGQCQQGAIQIGTLIEKTEPEGCATIPLLEQYCELLYQIHEDIVQNKKEIKNSARALKPLRQALIKIENSIKYDVKVRTEAVFLPYKASMWDSLESIWKAADEDEDCDAFVIPIPYYDKNPDGSFKEMHYEAEQYPKYVPVIDYKSYDFEKPPPDMIFIHNPYDEYNYVTSVPPFFFSKNLKQYTDQLVYVPYFILEELKPDNKGIIESIWHFCTAPGVIHADKVVVQSENMRQIYINVLIEKLGKNTRKYWENKILGVGSPKIDKVLSTKKEKNHLPDLWKGLIETNGVRKKVIFYNTSLGGMLKGNELYLDKLRSVLKTFRSRDDVVLWWRPHPLSETTINSMRPGLLQEYEQIIATYQQESWGIYDDTPDLHRAIAWSDAYYGDESSVAILFQAAKKPVLIQKVEEQPLVFENFIQIGDDYWFTSFNMNGLFRLNHKTWKADFMGCFPTEKDFRRLFFGIRQYKNLIIFAPFSAEQIALYRMDTSEFISIPLEKPENLMEYTGTQFPDEANIQYVPYSEHRKFLVCAAYKGYAFLFPCTYPAIVKINLETYETEYLCEPIAELGKIIKHPKSYYLRKGIQHENIVRLWSVAANAFVEFNMDTCRLEICCLINDGRPYTETICDDTGYWLFPNDTSKDIIKISTDLQRRTSIDLSMGDISASPPYLYAVDTGDFIYAFPATAKHVIRIAKSEQRAEAFPVLDSEKALVHSGPPACWQFFIAEKYGNTIFAYDAFSYKLISYDTVTGVVKRDTVKVSQELFAEADSFLLVWKTYYERITQAQKLYVRESCRKNLNGFLELLSKRSTVFLEYLHKAQKRLKENGEPLATGNCGNSIYEYAKDCLIRERGERL